MFKKIITYAWVLFFVGGIVWVLFLFVPRNSDVRACARARVAKKTAKSSSSCVATHQNRKGVTKELWLVQEGGERLHHRVRSVSSVLTLEPVDAHMELVERLQGVECWLQDRSGSSGGQLRVLKANEGVYSYRDLSFLAQSVSVSLFRFEDRDLPSTLTAFSPFLNGIAQEVSFSVSPSGPKFHAQRFKASLMQVP